MLILSRHRDESVVITGPDGSRTIVTIVDVRGDKVRLGFAAPPEVTVHRDEVQHRIDRECNQKRDPQPQREHGSR